MEYIVFNPATEEILRTGSCPDSMFFIIGKAGECVIEGVASDSKHKVDMHTLEIKDKTAKELAQSVIPVMSEDEKLIAEEMELIVREMAIEKLKKEGKIKDVKSEH
jgi:hypothetical protein